MNSSDDDFVRSARKPPGVSGAACLSEPPAKVKTGCPAFDFAVARRRVACGRDCGGGSMPRVTTSKPQTISYPAPGSRPHRHDDFSVDPHVVVLFGATGDLARRKLIPGLAYLDQSELAPNIEIVATSLEDISTDEFLEAGQGGHRRLRDAQTQQGSSGPGSPKQSPTCRRALAPRRWPPPSPTAEAKLGPEVRRLHYLSVPPKAARAVITMLRDANLVDRSRVVMEKPFGTDLASAVELNDFVHETFDESRSSASTTSSARRPRRTSWPSGSPTVCSNRSGTATSSTTSRSTSPRHWAWTNAPTSTRAPAPTRTWWSPICSR